MTNRQPATRAHDRPAAEALAVVHEELGWHDARVIDDVARGAGWLYQWDGRIRVALSRRVTTP